MVGLAEMCSLGGLNHANNPHQIRNDADKKDPKKEQNIH